MGTTMDKWYITGCICVAIITIVQCFWSRKKYPDEQSLLYRKASIIWGIVITFIGLMIYLSAESAVSSKWDDVNIHNPWIIVMLWILTFIGLILSACGEFELLHVLTYTCVLHSHIEEEQRRIKRMTENYKFLYGVESENEDIQKLLSLLEQKNRIQGQK